MCLSSCHLHLLSHGKLIFVRPLPVRLSSTRRAVVLDNFGVVRTLFPLSRFNMMADPLLPQADGMLDAGASLDELFPTEYRPLGQKDTNLISPPNSQNEAQKALNAFGSQERYTVASRQRRNLFERGSSVDLEGEIDLDELLDEEMDMQRAPPSPLFIAQDDNMDDELEAMLLAEQEIIAQPQPSSTNLLESNGLLGDFSPPNSPTLPYTSIATDQTPASVYPPADLVSISDEIRAMEAARYEPATIQTSSSRPISSTSTAIPKYIPAGFIGATTMDGKPIQFERRKRMRGWKPPTVMQNVDASQLLSRPIHQLLDAVQALKALDVVERAEAREDSLTPRKRQAVAADKMWVDKYRPAKFTELLGDERVHREVLGWLKEWDQCVFKRKNFRKERKQQYIQAKFGLPESSNAPAPWKDPHGRPKERILMLSGPPGLGKTTLAHIIGNHAGYNVYELNASDARTAGAVEDVIKTALESGSLRDPRPTLVVIDEIDGATGGGGGASGESVGFIRALVRLLEQGKGAGSKAAGLASKYKKRKDKRVLDKPLLRPIICICNDLYAPALRPLRPMAKLVRFNKPPSALVVKRLREVCEAEKLPVEARGLSLLSELTNGDIRSCLNALEFAKTKKIALTESAVRNAAVGIKDSGSTVHKAWEVLFRRQNRKEKVASSMKGANARNSDDGAAPWNSSHKASEQPTGAPQKASALVDTPQENVNRIVHEVMACNEYDKLAQGCFEHYPSLRTSDDGWKRYRAAHDWLHFGQSINDKVWAHGNYELLGFMPWSFVCWHLLFANVGNSLPEYPKVDYENHVKLSAFNELASQVVTALPDNVRSQFNRQSVVTELGPFLMRILTPDLRPVNNQLARPEDRQILASLVAIMSSLNIRFVQDRLSDEEAASTGQSVGQLVYKLDPPLDIFTQFEGKRSKENGPSRFAVRQMVVKETEKAALRKLTGADANDDISTANLAMAVYRTNGSTTSGGLQDKKDKVAVDFFGRPIVKTQSAPTGPLLSMSDLVPHGTKRGADGIARSGSVASHLSAPTREEVQDIKVFYRYHEGFSNAVRRPMKISALL